MESLKPKYTYNPTLQRLYQCVQHRAISPEGPLPPLDPLIAKYITPDEELFSAAAAPIKHFTEQFTFVKNGMSYLSYSILHTPQPSFSNIASNESSSNFNLSREYRKRKT